MEHAFELMPLTTNSVTAKVQKMFVGASQTQIQAAGTWFTLPAPGTANYTAMLQAAHDCTIFQVTPIITYDDSGLVLSITIPTGN